MSEDFDFDKAEMEWEAINLPKEAKPRTISKKVRQADLRGKEFIPEFIIQCLPTAAFQGNMAAENALDIEQYKFEDAPFWYGRVGAFGYVIAERHLEKEQGDE